MAGTTSNRGEEFARVSRSESNTYDSGRSNSASPMHPGFVKTSARKIPHATTATPPSDAPHKGTKAHRP